MSRRRAGHNRTGDPSKAWLETKGRHNTVTTKKTIAAIVMTAAMAAAPITMASADSFINKVLTGAAGIYGVKLIAGPLNTFINNILITNKVANQGKTKVVPILTVGGAAYVGAPQV